VADYWLEKRNCCLFVLEIVFLFWICFIFFLSSHFFNILDIRMGAAASITQQDQQKATELVTILKTKSESERVASLNELWKISDNVKYKEALCDPSLDMLSTLRTILESNDEAAHEPATGILWYLSRSSVGKVQIASSELQLIPVLISFLSKRKCTARTHALNSLVNVLQDKANHHYIVTPEFGFFKVITEQLSSDSENVSVYKCMSNFAIECTTEHAQLVIDQGLLELLARRLFSGIDRSARWIGNIPEEFCLRFLTRISSSKCGGDAIRSLNKPEFFMKFIKSSGLEKIYGTIIVANVYGKEENSAHTKALLASDRTILELIICVLDYSIHPKDESAAKRAKDRLNGFPYGIIGVKDISSALKNLSISDENKKELVKHPKLLDFSSEAILSYLSNNPHYTCRNHIAEASAGGGGSDSDSFENLVEFLLQLSFYFEEDEPLRTHFKKCSFDVKAVMKSIVELPLERNCPFESKQFANLLLKRLEPQPVKSIERKEHQSEQAAKKKVSDTVNEVASSSPSKPTIVGTHLHIMLSYSWSKNKPHVIALGKKLRGLGYDVWRDEEGSNIFPSMQGDIEDAMAEAIQKSYAMVVFVSQQYKESVNCRAEAKYARAREANGFLKLIYVMVDENYHTRSSPRAVDGWLGFMVGSDLWYPLWQMNQVEQTAKAIADLVGDHAKNNGSSSGVDFPSPIAANTQTVSATAVVTVGPITRTTAVASPTATVTGSASSSKDYEAAWKILNEPKKAIDSAAVTKLLDDYGVYSSEDFMKLDVDCFEPLAVLLKQVPQKCFREAMSL
jgi:hypothetical protein